MFINPRMAISNQSNILIDNIQLLFCFLLVLDADIYHFHFPQTGDVLLC